ncbi:MAG: flp pilus-assembly TadE/G-like family protein [Propionibacteriaceae bacterium]|nr:flp pilus-assembly TadE/G-like family protein [Propionibacteriaceae bacterium]
MVGRCLYRGHGAGRHRFLRRARFRGRARYPARSRSPGRNQRWPLTGTRPRPVAYRACSDVERGQLKCRSRYGRLWHGWVGHGWPRCRPVGHGWAQPRPLPSTRRQRAVGRGLDDERGSGSLLAVAASLALIGFAAVVVWVVAWFGCLHRADQVADLASSAGAEAFAVGGDPCGVAARVAELNKARLTSCQSGGGPGHFVVKAEVAVPLHPRVPGAPEEVRSRAAAGVVG